MLSYLLSRSSDLSVFATVEGQFAFKRNRSCTYYVSSVNTQGVYYSARARVLAMVMPRPGTLLKQNWEQRSWHNIAIKAAIIVWQNKVLGGNSLLCEAVHGGLEVTSVNGAQQNVNGVVKVLPHMRRWHVHALLHVAARVQVRGLVRCHLNEQVSHSFPSEIYKKNIWKLPKLKITILIYWHRV